MAYPGTTEYPAPPSYTPYPSQHEPSYPQPSHSGAYPSPEGNYPSPAGGYPSPAGSYPSPAGSYPSPAGGYPSPAGSYPAPQTMIAPSTVTIVTGGIINPIGVGAEPTRIKCQMCNETVLTKVKYEPSTSTYLWSGVLCLMAWPLCCCLIPLCTNSTKTALHTCPKCHCLIGTFRR